MKLDPLPRYFPLDRAIALSDAVFAVVITLLVLGIEVPDVGGLSGPNGAAAAEKLGHQILVYLVSFWIVAMYWAQQSALFGSIRRMDRAMLVLNLTFLLPVTLLPFVTQLTGARVGEWWGLFVFALTNLFAVIVFHRMWKLAISQPDLWKGSDIVALAKRVSFGIRVYVFIIVVAVFVGLVDVRVGLVCFVLTPIAHFYNYVRDPLRSDREAESENG